MRALKTVALTLMFCAAGCYRIKYTITQPAAPAPNYDEWHHNMIFGLAEISPPVNISQACPNGASVVENEQTFVNGLVSFLTLLWIWEPTTVRVTCGVGKADADQRRRSLALSSAVSPPTNFPIQGW